MLWHLTQVGALVDISYILNTASRIAGGDVPYSGFRLAHPPLTFLVQAALIRAFGPHYVVQMIYAAVASGAASTLTYAILRRVRGASGARSDALAFVLALPLIPLGIYAIFPHAHYDPDAALAVLAATWAVLAARVRPSAARWLLAGALLVVPLFVKQNIGGAFLPLAFLAVAADARSRGAGRDLAACAAGTAVALLGAALLIQLAAGLDAYVRWTLLYAFNERGVLAERVGWFGDPPNVLVGLAIPVAAVAASRLPPRLEPLLFAVVACAPLAILAGVNVALLWVPVLIAAVLLALVGIVQRRMAFEDTLPLVFGGTLMGTLMSQGLGGSAFGTYPMLVITVACLARSLSRYVRIGSPTPAVLAVTASVLLLASGVPYVLSEERMRFIDTAMDEPVERSSYPALAGMSARGRYVAEVDDLIAWITTHVQPGEGVTFLPGEDPVYFALGLRPGLPVVQLIDGSDPYTPDELARIADETKLRWVVVKDRLQLRALGSIHDDVVPALTKNADLVEALGPYRIFRRR